MPGEKRAIGPRAERLYEEKREKGAIVVKPIREGVNCSIDRPPSVDRAAPKPSDLIIGAAVLAPAALLAAKKIKEEPNKSA